MFFPPLNINTDGHDFLSISIQICWNAQLKKSSTWNLGCNRVFCTFTFLQPFRQCAHSYKNGLYIYYMVMSWCHENCNWFILNSISSWSWKLNVCIAKIIHARRTILQKIWTTIKNDVGNISLFKLAIC